MALHLILGGSGSGKSHKLYNYIIEQSLDRPDMHYIVISPEQYTMATQRKLIELHPAHGLMQIEVLSFQRLANRVFQELGLDTHTILDDTGKSLIIRKVVENHRKELTAFSKNVDKNGFVAELKSVLSELLQYAITPDELREIAAKMSSNAALSAKLSDIQTVYEAFMEYIKKDYITAEGILDVLGDNASGSSLIPGCILAIDGFTGFTPVQYKLLARLMTTAKEMYVTVTIDSREKAHVRDGYENLFALSKETINSLYRLADENHVEVAKEIVCSAPKRFAKSEDISFLEQNVFRYSYRRYPGKPKQLKIYCADNPKEELRYAAAQILKATRQQGMRYRDIAVVCADMDVYKDIAANLLEQNNIPAFIDCKRSVMGNPMIEFIRSALEIIEKNYSYETVFRYLRTGLTGITPEETDILENYCLALGIRGRRKWYSQWDGNYTGRGSIKADLSVINELRYRVVQSLEMPESMYEQSKGGRIRVARMLELLYKFIVNADIEQKMLKLSQELEAENQLSLSSQYRQIYAKVMTLFDKIYALLGDEEIKRSEFAKILDAGFEEIKIGLVPPSSDCVLVGDIERTRLDNIRMLIFVGVNDGMVPRRTTGGGLLSELDRNALQNADVQLSPDVRQQSFIQRFYLYLNITKPSECLHVTYSTHDMDGKGMRPSYFVHTLLKLYPRLSVDGVQSVNEDADIWLRIPKAVVRWQQADNAEVTLNEYTAHKLYGEKLIQSVTRLESYAACEFAHFMKYGLLLNERQKYKLEAKDTGSILHQAMEQISNTIHSMGVDFKGLPEQTRRQLVDNAVESAANEYGNYIFADSSRNAYRIEKIKQLADRTVWAIGKQLENEDFIPQEFEVHFSLPMEIKDKSYSVKLEGSIDRIDICEDDYNVYVKIVDYKTGRDRFELDKTYYGLKLQLMTYMKAALLHEAHLHPDKKVIPAGAFYYDVDNPIVEKDRENDASAIEQKILDELTYDGLANEELPENVLGAGKDTVKQENHITTGQFERLSAHITDKMAQMVDDMMQGDIAVNPYQDGKTVSCTYCLYRSVCGFYNDLPGCTYRRIPKMKNEEIWEELSREAGEDSAQEDIPDKDTDKE